MDGLHNLLRTQSTSWNHFLQELQKSQAIVQTHIVPGLRSKGTEVPRHEARQGRKATFVQGP
jgi:hypothetical protein